MDKKFALRALDGREYPIIGLTSIGRNADCRIRLNDQAISGHHANVWVVQDGLWLSDNNSTNGVFVNDERIASNQGYLLHPGDRIHLGNSYIELEVVGPPSPIAQPNRVSQPARPTRPASKPARRLAPLACLTMLGCLLILGLVTLSSYFFLGNNVTALLPGQTRVLAVSTPQSLLKPQEYAASGQTLAQAVARLNESELAFIRTAKNETSSLPEISLVRFTIPLSAHDTADDQLRQVAADAFRVATLADSLGRTTAAQDGGSQQAGQMAAQYRSVANLGAALVIEAQDLRKGLANGSTTQEAASNVVAEYGARLWNPAVNDPAKPGNPFTTYLSDPSSIPLAQLLSVGSSAQIATQLGTNLSSWIAASGEEIKKKFDIPDLSTVEDALLIQDLLTPDGQKNGDAAKQAAANIIKPGGANSIDVQSANAEAQLVATFSSALTVGTPDNKPATTPSSNMFTFPNGPAMIISQPPSDDVIAGLISSDGSLVAQVPVKATAPLVNLEISNIIITMVNPHRGGGFDTFEADVVYRFDVKWTTANLTAPQFELTCSGGNHFKISTTAGSQHVTAKGLLVLYPGREDASCFAQLNANILGSASVNFLVGDSAGATERVDQLNTQEKSRRLTEIANEKTRVAVEEANAAATQKAIDIMNAVSTEVYGTRTAEFMATITEIARQTKDAPPPVDTLTPTPTATFAPVLMETFFHPGDVHTVVSKLVLKPGRLYRVCLSGAVYISTGVVYPSDIDYVNGIKVPLSGCVVLEGNGAVVRVSCSKGEPAEEPGGFTVQVYDLGPQ